MGQSGVKMEAALVRMTNTSRWDTGMPTADMFRAPTGKLLVLQPIWDLRIGYEYYMTSPLFPIVLSTLFYIMCVTPWTLIDLYGKEWKWIQRYKIQTDQVVTWPLVRRAMMLTLWNHLLYILPVSMAQWTWTPDTELPVEAPPLFEFLWHHLASLMWMDLQYYVYHIIHHKVRWLYRHVHGVHHEYHSPSTWVTQYLHPWELITIGIISVTSPWAFGAHAMTELSFMQFAIVVSVEDHLGYELPGMPHRWFPFYGGSIKHDMHHNRPLTNFQPFFNYFDRLFGTECPGLKAGGYKSKALLGWEKRKEELRLQRRKEMVKQEDNYIHFDDDQYDEDMIEDTKVKYQN